MVRTDAHGNRYKQRLPDYTMPKTQLPSSDEDVQPSRKKTKVIAQVHATQDQPERAQEPKSEDTSSEGKSVAATEKSLIQRYDEGESVHESDLPTTSSSSASQSQLEDKQAKSVLKTTQGQDKGHGGGNLIVNVNMLPPPTMPQQQALQPEDMEKTPLVSVYDVSAASVIEVNLDVCLYT